MTTWHVALETRRGSSTMASVAGYVAEDLPKVGDVIDVGGSMAEVTGFLEQPAGARVVIEAVREAK